MGQNGGLSVSLNRKRRACPRDDLGLSKAKSRLSKGRFLFVPNTVPPQMLNKLWLLVCFLPIKGACNRTEAKTILQRKKLSGSEAGERKKTHKERNTSTTFSQDCPGMFLGEFCLCVFPPHKE